MRDSYLRHEVLVITVISSVLYVGVGMYVRVLLNWIVGPLWPIACVWFVPPLVRRVLRWDDPLPDEAAAP
jgi:hypothetical protein